jgi:hypothetical protein
MLKVNKNLGSITLLILISNPCQADFYIGGQEGLYKTEIKDFELMETSDYTGWYAGYIHGSGLGLEYSELSGDGKVRLPERYRQPDEAVDPDDPFYDFIEEFLEALFGTELSAGGEVDPIYYIDSSASAAYLTYHSADALSSGFFFKAKIGQIREELELRVPDEIQNRLPKIEEERTAYGAGVGWRFGTVGLDLDYTNVSGDAQYLKFGVKLNF